MVSLTCTVDHQDGITLVTARLDGGAVPHRVRLANCLDGPVWPPRREGVPEAGWDEDGLETVVPVDGTVAVGYASPAEPTDPPVELVDSEVDEGTSRDDPPTPASALRKLGDPSPPRDAVPVPTDSSSTPSKPQSVHEESTLDREATTDQQAPASGPESVAAWLDAAEERVALAEQLTAARSVPEATAALREVGSLAEAADLSETVQGDADALAAVADRARTLAERADATDVPLSTLQRLA